MDEMVYSNLFLVAALMLNVLYGILIYNQGPKSRVNRFYTLIIIFVFLWLFGEINMRGSNVGSEAEFWAKFSFIGLSVLPSIILEFTTFYPRNRRLFDRIKNFRVILYVPSFSFLFLAFSGRVLIRGLILEDNVYTVSYGSLFSFYTLYFTLFLLASLINLTSSLRESKSQREKRQIGLFSLGLVLFLFVGTVVDMVPSIYGWGQYRLLGLTSAISMGLMAHSISQRGLQNISPALEAVKRKADKWGGATINPGFSYLIQEKKSKNIYKIFMEAIHQGWYGLCFTRDMPAKIRETYDIKTTPVIWLTEVDSKEPSLRPQELEMISHTISEFIEKSGKSVIIIDGLEYLITYNKFTRVLRMIQHVKDYVSTSSSVLLISISPQT
ncbi:DUF835 domain-containing protein, partial [Candidatus Altiarchaeota archaeon]